MSKEVFPGPTPLVSVGQDVFDELKAEVYEHSDRNFHTAGTCVSSDGTFRDIAPRDAKHYEDAIQNATKLIIEQLFDAGFHGKKDIEFQYISGNADSESMWHVDNHLLKKTILLASDTLPTQFAVGSVEANSELAKRRHEACELYGDTPEGISRFDIDQKLHYAIKDDLSCDNPLLSVDTAQTHSVNLIPRDAVHRAQPFPRNIVVKRSVLMIYEHLDSVV